MKTAHPTSPHSGISGAEWSCYYQK